MSPRKKTTDRGQRSRLRHFPVHANNSRAQGCSTPLVRRRSSCPPPSPNLMLTQWMERAVVRLGVLLRPTKLSATMPSASRMPPPPEGHRIGARRRRTLVKTINHLNRLLISTDRLNREDSQLAGSLEGESTPSPAGKNLPSSYPRTRFRRERAGVKVTS